MLPCFPKRNARRSRTASFVSHRIALEPGRARVSQHTNKDKQNKQTNETQASHRIALESGRAGRESRTARSVKHVFSIGLAELRRASARSCRRVSSSAQSFWRKRYVVAEAISHGCLRASRLSPYLLKYPVTPATGGTGRSAGSRKRIVWRRRGV